MKIYLAGDYFRRQELAAVAHRLQNDGHIITSTWLNGTDAGADADPTPDDMARWATRCLHDLMDADVVVVFTTTQAAANGAFRGGHMVELGIAIAHNRYRPVCIVGQRTNIFTALPYMVHCDDTDQLVDVLQHLRTANGIIRWKLLHDACTREAGK